MLTAIVSFLLQYLVLALMLSIGLAARPGDLGQIVRRPRLYVRALLVMELAVPLLAILVVTVLPLPPRGAALFLLVAVAPGAPFIPAATKGKGARYSPVGLNLLVLVSLLAPLTVPAWLWIIDRVHPLGLGLDVTPLQVLRQVVTIALAPLTLGLAIRRLLPRAADVLWRVAHTFFLVAAAVAIAVLLYLGAPVLLEVAPLTFAGGLIIVIGSALLGAWAAAPEPEARRTTGVAAALGNPALALAILAASYPRVEAAAFIAAYLIFRKLALIPFELWVRRGAHRGTPGRGVPAALPSAPSSRPTVASGPRPQPQG